MINQPQCIFLVGVNGAGKSTLRYLIQQTSSILQNYMVIDPDYEARKYLKDYDTQTANIKGNRDAIELFKQTLELRQNFILESTLSGKTIFNRYKKAVEQGYHIQTWCVGLESVELHQQRVATRVQRGGHYIADDLIQKRYQNMTSQLKQAYTFTNKLTFIDNSEKFMEVAFLEHEQITLVQEVAWVNNMLNQLKKKAS